MPMSAYDLSWASLVTLAPHIREADRLECGGDPVAALSFALTKGGGQSWEFRAKPQGGDIIGAFGWTKMGTVWFLSRELTFPQSKEILSATPQWVSMMIDHSGREFLENHVDCENRSAIKWIKRSNCFHLQENLPLTNAETGRRVFYFRTKQRGAL